MSDAILDLPYIASIPYLVQSDDEIPDSVKIYYGQLVALSVKFGYCFATDDQLSQMKSVSIDTIKRWNRILERSGYIKRDTKNVPCKEADGKFLWKKKRKIYVNGGFEKKRPEKQEIPTQPEEKPPEKSRYSDFSNNFSEGVKNDTSYEGVKNDTSYEGVKNDTCNSKSLSENSKVQPKVVIFSCLDSLGIPQSMKLKLSADYEEEDLKIAVKRSLRWEGRPNDEVAIMTTLNRAETWNDIPTKEEKEMSNMEFLKTLQHLDGKKISEFNVTIGRNYIEFVYGVNCKIFSAEDSDFKKSLVEYLEKINDMEKK